MTDSLCREVRFGRLLTIQWYGERNRLTFFVWHTAYLHSWKGKYWRVWSITFRQVAPE